MGRKSNSKNQSAKRKDLQTVKKSDEPADKDVQQPSTSKLQAKAVEKNDNGGSSNASKDVPKSSLRDPSREIEEKEHYIEQLITSLKDQRNEERKGECIARVINSISDILKLEESLESEVVPEGETKAKEEKYFKPEPEVSEVESPEIFCSFCKSVSKTRCTGCRIVFYCGKECQKRDWKTHKDVCRSYSIAKRKGAGRILVASRDLKAEDLILNEAPLMIGPRSGPNLICLACYRRTTQNDRCAKCSLPVCSEECQNSLDHSDFECKVLANAGINLRMDEEGLDRFYDAITAVRCLMAQKKDPKTWMSAMERFETKFLEQIGMTENNNVELQIILKQKFKIGSNPDLCGVSDSEIRKILGLLQIHNVPTKLPYCEVQGLYSISSLLSHSCVPNTKLSWDKSVKKLKVTATEIIPKGTPITTIYTDILWGTRARRNHLQQTRMISCTCRRCKDPSELSTYFSALICQRCPKKIKYILPLDPLDNSSPWACNGCSYQVSSEDVLQQTLSLGAHVSSALLSPSIESLENLHNVWNQKFHSNHYHLHAIKHSLFQLYGRSQEKAQEKNDLHWEEIAKKERACKEFLTVCSLLDPALANTIPFVGLTFFEYHKTILQNAKRNFGLARITTLQLKKRMLLSKELLRKAMEIFKGEEMDTPEGQLYLTCQEEIISIGKWMLAVGLV